jgi:hypothetical protein
MGQLAQKIREKYPDQWQDKNDDELEIAWLAYYPGRTEYEKLADTKNVNAAQSRKQVSDRADAIAFERSGDPEAKAALGDAQNVAAGTALSVGTGGLVSPEASEMALGAGEALVGGVAGLGKMLTGGLASVVETPALAAAAEATRVGPSRDIKQDGMVRESEVADYESMGLNREDAIKASGMELRAVDEKVLRAIRDINKDINVERTSFDQARARVEGKPAQKVDGDGFTMPTGPEAIEAAQAVAEDQLRKQELEGRVVSDDQADFYENPAHAIAKRAIEGTEAIRRPIDESLSKTRLLHGEAGEAMHHGGEFLPIVAGAVARPIETTAAMGGMVAGAAGGETLGGAVAPYTGIEEEEVRRIMGETGGLAGLVAGIGGARGGARRVATSPEGAEAILSSSLPKVARSVMDTGGGAAEAGVRGRGTAIRSLLEETKPIIEETFGPSVSNSRRVAIAEEVRKAAVEDRVRENVAKGLPEEDARALAEREIPVDPIVAEQGRAAAEHRAGVEASRVSIGDEAAAATRESKPAASAGAKDPGSEVGLLESPEAVALGVEGAAHLAGAGARLMGIPIPSWIDWIAGRKLGQFARGRAAKKQKAAAAAAKAQRKAEGIPELTGVQEAPKPPTYAERVAAVEAELANRGYSPEIRKGIAENAVKREFAAEGRQIGPEGAGVEPIKLKPVEEPTGAPAAIAEGDAGVAGAGLARETKIRELVAAMKTDSRFKGMPEEQLRGMAAKSVEAEEAGVGPSSVTPAKPTAKPTEKPTAPAGEERVTILGGKHKGETGVVVKRTPGQPQDKAGKGKRPERLTVRLEDGTEVKVNAMGAKKAKSKKAVAEDAAKKAEEDKAFGLEPEDYTPAAPEGGGRKRLPVRQRKGPEIEQEPIKVKTAEGKDRESGAFRSWGYSPESGGIVEVVGKNGDTYRYYGISEARANQIRSALAEEGASAGRVLGALRKEAKRTVRVEDAPLVDKGTTPKGAGGTSVTAELEANVLSNEIKAATGWEVGRLGNDKYGLFNKQGKQVGEYDSLTEAVKHQKRRSKFGQKPTGSKARKGKKQDKEVVDAITEAEKAAGVTWGEPLKGPEAGKTPKAPAKGKGKGKGKKAKATTKKAEAPAETGLDHRAPNQKPGDTIGSGPYKGKTVVEVDSDGVPIVFGGGTKSASMAGRQETHGVPGREIRMDYGLIRTPDKGRVRFRVSGSDGNYVGKMKVGDGGWKTVAKGETRLAVEEAIDAIATSGEYSGTKYGFNKGMIKEVRTSKGGKNASLTDDLIASIDEIGSPELRAAAEEALQALDVPKAEPPVLTVENVTKYLPKELAKNARQDGQYVVIKTGRGEITLSPEGYIGLTAETAGKHGYTVAEAKAAGLSAAGEAQSWQFSGESIIRLAERNALPHETAHVFINLFAKKSEINRIYKAVNAEAKRLNKAPEEIFAEGYQKFWESRQQFRDKHSNTALGRIYMKIHDFALAVKDKILPSLEGEYRRVESGKAFGRTKSGKSSLDLKRKMEGEAVGEAAAEIVTPKKKQTFVSPEKAEFNLRQENKYATKGLPKQKKGKDGKLTSPSTPANKVFKDKDGNVWGEVNFDQWLERTIKNLGGTESKNWRNARNWYTDMRRLIRREFPELDTHQQNVLAFAITQRGEAPTGGVMVMMRAIEAAQGSMARKKPGTAQFIFDQLFAGGDIQRGFAAKLSDFTDSLQGRTSRTWTGGKGMFQPAAIDRHAMLDVGFISKLKDSQSGVHSEGGLSRFGKNAIVDTGNSGQPTASQYFYAIQKYNEFAKKLNEMNFDGGGWTADQVQAVGWTSIRKALGYTSEDAYSVITRNTRQVTFDALGVAKDSPLAKVIGDKQANPIELPAFTERVAPELAKKVADATGVKVKKVSTAGGQMTIDVLSSPEGMVDFVAGMSRALNARSGHAFKALASGNRKAGVLNVKVPTAEAAHQAWLRATQRNPKLADIDYNVIEVGKGSFDIMFEGSGVKLKNLTNAAEKALKQDGAKAEGMIGTYQKITVEQNYKTNTFKAETSATDQPQMTGEMTFGRRPNMQEGITAAEEYYANEVANLLGTSRSAAARSKAKSDQSVVGGVQRGAFGKKDVIRSKAGEKTDLRPRAPKDTELSARSKGLTGKSFHIKHGTQTYKVTPTGKTFDRNGMKMVEVVFDHPSGARTEALPEVLLNAMRDQGKVPGKAKGVVPGQKKSASVKLTADEASSLIGKEDLTPGETLRLMRHYGRGYKAARRKAANVRFIGVDKSLRKIKKRRDVVAEGPKTSASLDFSEKSGITATGRGVSAPAKAHAGIVKGKTVLDFGAGKGADVPFYEQAGAKKVAKYDPNHAPEMPAGTFDVVTNTFVGNVLPKEARHSMWKEAYGKAKEKLVVSVRSDKIPGKAYEDGVITSKGTFQRSYKKGELVEELQKLFPDATVEKGPASISGASTAVVIKGSGSRPKGRPKT